MQSLQHVMFLVFYYGLWRGFYIRLLASARPELPTFSNLHQSLLTEQIEEV